MSKKRKPLRCSNCGRLLLEVIGYCNHVHITCPDCKASLLVDVSEDGSQIVKLIPEYSSLLQTNAVRMKNETTN